MSTSSGSLRGSTPRDGAQRTFLWGQQTYLMGVLNVTPDSFSDGGQFTTVEAALRQAHQMVSEGADILDIGGQSTRPQADEVTLEAELQRVIPVIEVLRRDQFFAQTPISIDTTRSQVAHAAIAAGADIINDISGGVFDPQMLHTTAVLNVPIVLMHRRGTPKTMQTLTQYQDLIAEILQFLDQQIRAAIAAGIDRKQIVIDPGIGFAKTYDQSLQILRCLDQFQRLNCPILVGVSRKSFIGHVLNQPDPKQRVWGTAAACVSAIANGADIVRVHDVAQMRDVCRVADAIWRS
ncbi:dihydropteroate synthase [Myxacorys almedinensis]|uniref:Dihydropteroate synthase n=1 Tax=Myxacorys almedinensis A TaxID=2690445 RepID=A0A8J7Z1R9_9CYAN|nr:dihydropteroate synthase [Myxacorys almedinensis]NDJ18472.1 dihydropteroate synthase [Myxacorys almedinensis A]